MKRLLAVSFYWPPSRSVGTNRITSFCTHLEEFGWTPTILTTYPPGADRAACDRADETSPWTIHRVSPGDEGWLNRLATLLHLPGRLCGKTREELFDTLAWRARAGGDFPDPGTYCNRYIGPLARRINQLSRQDSFDAMFITAPPQSMIVLAARLGAGPLPLLLDLRDPWTGGFDYERTGRADRKAHQLEARALNRARAITCVSPLQARHLAEQYPGREGAIHTIANMFSPSLGESALPSEPGDTFHLTLLGSTYDDPTPLRMAIGQLHCNGLDLHLDWIGHNVQDLSGWQALIDTGVVTLAARLPREQALARAAQASAFWLEVPMTDRADYVIRSKVYDYLAIGRYVIGTAPQPAAIRDLLDGLCRYELIASRESSEIASLIERTLVAWQVGRLGPHIDREKLDELSPRNQTRRLVDIIEEITP